jgi:transposase
MGAITRRSCGSVRCGWSPRSGAEYPSEWAAIAAVASKLGIGTAETLRKSVRRAEVDTGQRPGITSEERAEIKGLKQENAELRRANEILKAASVNSTGQRNTVVWLGQQMIVRISSAGRMSVRRAQASVAAASASVEPASSSGLPWPTIRVWSERNARPLPARTRTWTWVAARSPVQCPLGSAV